MFGTHFHIFFSFAGHSLCVTKCERNLSPQDEASSLRAFEQRPAEVGLIWQRVGVVGSVRRMTLLTCLLAQRRCTLPAAPSVRMNSSPYINTSPTLISYRMSFRHVNFPVDEPRTPPTTPVSVNSAPHSRAVSLLQHTPPPPHNNSTQVDWV